MCTGRSDSREDEGENDDKIFFLGKLRNFLVRIKIKQNQIGREIKGNGNKERSAVD